MVLRPPAKFRSAIGALLLVLPLVTVYPRVCGGTTISRRTMERRSGLTPRVRGHRLVSPPCAQAGRSIPACAGAPGSPSSFLAISTVYPRVCGGTGISHSALSHAHGLSPRVRGHRWYVLWHVDMSRSIPACAGAPCGCSESWASIWVYPRVCGGTAGSRRWLSPGRGLSPRVRGHPTPTPEVTPLDGSIPACAGAPPTPGPWRYRCTVYPRVCGGTLARGQESTTRWVYPRVCGGTVGIYCVGVVDYGLSPRVRGHRGNLLRWRWTTVYPRVCGGTLR